MNREEDIVYDFLESDRIWPPQISSKRGHPFIKALIEVLRRLPNDIYEEVSEVIWFVIEDSQIMAMNVPFRRVYPSSCSALEVRFDTIVIFHQALACPHNALIGLLAHELAHSIVSLREHKENEQAADDLVVQWGFSKELEASEAEQQKSASS